MKKVRYLAGAAGVAPVLGLMMPPGNAMATVTHSPAGQGKSVSLVHLRASARPHNTGGCNSPASITSLTESSLFGTMHGTPGVSCISRVTASLPGGHTELDMRTRYYNFNGGKIGGDHFDTAHRLQFATSWRHTDTVFAHKVCIALVEASPKHTWKYGDICLNTSQL